ncbi:response regulator receiver protein, partial [Serratia nematodiphila DZ0503SBS1]
MKKTPNYIDAISALLTLKGVGDRKHASTMANILNLQYNSAKQKLDGKRGITLDEV